MPRSFLQGQLSSDVDQLGATPALTAGLHNPQGRCLAVLRLLRVDQDQILVGAAGGTGGHGCQRTCRSTCCARGSASTTVSGQWRVYGAAGPDAEAAASTRLGAPMDASGLRQLIVAPRPEPPPDGDLQSARGWTLEDIAAGLPQVVAATSGAFTAQMLNLDLIGAISFSKGCYTGQEIIARAHYLGTRQAPDATLLHRGMAAAGAGRCASCLPMDVARRSSWPAQRKTADRNSLR